MLGSPLFHRPDKVGPLVDRLTSNMLEQTTPRRDGAELLTLTSGGGWGVGWGGQEASSCRPRCEPSGPQRLRCSSPDEIRINRKLQADAHKLRSNHQQGISTHSGNFSPQVAEPLFLLLPEASTLKPVSWRLLKMNQERPKCPEQTGRGAAVPQHLQKPQADAIRRTFLLQRSQMRACRCSWLEDKRRFRSLPR